MRRKIQEMLIDKKFWQNKRVLVTGHTGFKGSWLALWLCYLGAKVTGYALEPPTKPNLFELARIGELINNYTGDVRDLKSLKRIVNKTKPEIVFHLAAQSLVRESYKTPVETYDTNVMGTANLLEAARGCQSIRSIVIVTSDKCYENIETGKRKRQKGFKEEDKLGGYDPYSSSKACAEIIAAAYRCSFLHKRVAVATARAGNVIGGGDWAADRLIPDFIRAKLAGKIIKIRNPKAIRPWQHVLEPLSGYLILAQKLYNNGQKYASAWNFGPDKSATKSVEWLIRSLCYKWDKKASYKINNRSNNPHEAGYLRLDNKKAKKLIGWRPKWGITTALDKIIEWMLAYQEKQNIRKICWQQIREYDV